MRTAPIFCGLAPTLAVAFAVTAQAQSTGLPPRDDIEVKQTDIVPKPPLAKKIATAHSENEGIVKAYPYRLGQIQLVGVGTGSTYVDATDETGKSYRMFVWVVDSGKLASAGYDPTATQLSQLVMPPKYSKPVPAGGAKQVNRIVSSNPSVATARTDMPGRIMVYSTALGDTFISFADALSGKRYQLHVWVTKNPNFKPPIPGPGPNGGGRGRGPIGSGGGKNILVSAPLGPFDACLVGTWRMQSIAWTSPFKPRGGGGIVLEVKPDGTVSVDYGSMQPELEQFGEKNWLRGAAHGRITASNGTARVMRVDQANITHTFVDSRGKTWTNNVGQSLGYGTPGMNPPSFHYSCTAESLSYPDFLSSYSYRRVKR
jgi:hypothetical protein